MPFHVGQEVLCVNDDVKAFQLPGFHYIGGLNGLKKGCTYTVRAAGMHPFFNIPTVWINEITRPIFNGKEAGFAAERFAPVKKTQTDISVFEALLNPTPEQIEAEQIRELVE